jgi:cation diffusion facilitator CzcD-associated flavoprotein CzcO
VHTSRTRIAIIGGGITGLAQADVFGRCGFEAVVFEQGPRIGGVWARAYPDVSLQNTAAQYHLSSFPWPFTPDEHPTGTQILRYLEAAVAARKLDVRVAHEVVSAREAAGGGWELTVRHTGAPGAEPASTQHRFDHLVIATGQYTEGKHRLTLPGQEAFAGRVVTEREVTDLAMFAGQRVAVVGFGKSALDMACLAVARGATVHHVFRTPRWTLPRHVFGIHITRLLFNRFDSVMMTSWAHPTAIERGLHRLGPVVQGFWAGLQTVIRATARRQARGTGPEGAARLAQVLPAHPLLADLRSAAALAPDAYYRLVAEGKILPHRAEVTGLSADGLQLSTGATLPCNVVVLAVGSRAPVFPFLADHHRALLEGEADGVQLYRHLVHPRIANLGFGGFNHSFMHMPCVEVGALWLAAWWRGELALPPVDEMERAIAHVTAWKRAHVHFEPSRSCAVATRFQQYLDILLGDLGLSPYRKLPNVFAEIFARYGAADYAGLVEQYLARPPAAPRRPVALPT